MWFVRHHRIENFFIDNYDHPIVEAGVLLKDMVYLLGEAYKITRRTGNRVNPVCRSAS